MNDYMNDFDWKKVIVYGVAFLLAMFIIGVSL